MSGTETNGMDETGPRGQQEPARAASMARLLPSVTFGMRAAVLAGVVVAGVPAAANALSPAVTAGLSGPITQVIGMGWTTCCGQGTPGGGPVASPAS
ncbi:MAG TPA: hypothetical protein VKS82_19485 [Streptosporangiaceae bacterium]|nr:hypothetical protein [Streptosporangiaceae bacterium]